MTTLEIVPKKNKPEPSAEEKAAKELVRLAREQGLSLTGPDGLLKQFTKSVLETALNEEMTEHLGHEKHRAPDERDSSNIRNGTRPKTVLTEATGQVEIEVPRDRDGSLRAADREEAATAADRGRRDRAVAVCEGVDDRGDLRAFRRDLRRLGEQGDDLPDHRQGDGGDGRLGQPAPRRGLRRRSSSTPSWSKCGTVRSGTGRSTPRSGSRLAGEKDVLGLWAGTGGEGAKFWLAVLTDLKNRGINDVFFLVCDGLKGLPDVVANVWPLTTTQTCIIHLIRNTFRLASRRDWDRLKRDVKLIYTAPNETAARAALDELAEVWGARYPAIIRLWRNAWAEFIPFLDYGACRRIAEVAWADKNACRRRPEPLFLNVWSLWSDRVVGRVRLTELLSTDRVG